MSTTTLIERLLTLSEYLEREEMADLKHEFHNGKLVEMPDVTLTHALISSNFGTFLNFRLFRKKEHFLAYGSNAQIYIPDLDKALYADVSVVKDKAILFQHYKNFIINTLLTVEVLSDETQSYDRNKKFEYYRKLPTFKEYVLVHQHEPKIEIYYCKNGNRNVWQYSFETGLDARIKLQSIGCTIRLKDIYRDVEF